MLILLLASACVPALVRLECDNGSPLCDALVVLQDERPLATGVSITGVAVYQDIEQPLLVDGVPETDIVAPLVAGKDAIVRLMVTVGDDFQARRLTGRAYVYNESGLYGAGQADLEISGDSDWTFLDSTFNIPIVGAAFTPGELGIAAEVVEIGPKAGGKEEELAPEFGPVPVPFENVGDALRIQLVPISYEADESGRLPDTSDEQVETLRAYMSWMYPAPEVELTIGDVLPTQTNVDAGGGGWDTLLSEVAESRGDQGVSDDVYLYGLFEPAESFGEFCGGGCVLGLSNLAGGATDATGRSSIGLGYTGAEAALTMTHEVGHAHGRSHSPGCGAGGPDPDYPNEEGLLDYPGINTVSDILQGVESTYDVMSYCSPVGVSAFTGLAFAQRIRDINDAYNGPLGVGKPWLSAWVYTNGSIEWGSDRRLHGELWGEPRSVDLLDADGQLLGTVEGRFSPFPDLPAAGSLLIPDLGVAVDRVRFAGRESGSRETSRFLR